MTLSELALALKYSEEFKVRDCKLAAVCAETIDVADVFALAGETEKKDFPFPIFKSDIAINPISTRAVFILDPDRIIRIVSKLPNATGRNFDEILRQLDSVQLTATYAVVTPGNWHKGHECGLSASVKDEDAAKIFPMGVKTQDLPSGSKHLRVTPDPTIDRVMLPKWFVPLEYDMTLHPNVDPSSSFRFEGSQTLVCWIERPGHDTITLHSKELSILSASFNGIEAQQINYDVEENTVHFKFPKALPVGRGEMKTEFIATHNNQMAGFYRSGYKDALGNTRVMVSTQFEALDARRCFPCVDEPDAKAVFKATLIIDAGLTALSNMPELFTSLLTGGKKKKIVFMPSPKMSTYLLAFAVGEFDFVQRITSHGVVVRVYTPPTKADQGTFALDVACKSLDLYGDFFGMPYPLPKLDMIAISEFAMGAMENWGLVTYREVEILIADGAAADQKQRVCTVITHELAHQWFGNAVTMRWWSGTFASCDSHLHACADSPKKTDARFLQIYGLTRASRAGCKRGRPILYSRNGKFGVHLLWMIKRRRSPPTL